jgi:hypothetical protein
MNENGAYTTPASPAPVFPVRATAPVPESSFPSAITEHDGAFDSEDVIEGAPRDALPDVPRCSVSTSTDPPPVRQRPIRYLSRHGAWGAYATGSIP